MNGLTILFPSRVTLREDGEGELQFVGLNKHLVSNQEEGIFDYPFLHLLIGWTALGLAFLGDTNRMVAETAMNQASTRSHCIFTVYIDAKKEGTDKIRRSKLHLVDLAG